jgi:hypothetical protein
MKFEHIVVLLYHAQWTMFWFQLFSLLHLGNRKFSPQCRYYHTEISNGCRKEVALHPASAFFTVPVQGINVDSPLKQGQSLQ